MKDKGNWLEALIQIFVTVLAILTLMHSIYGNRIDSFSQRLTTMEGKVIVLEKELDRVDLRFEYLLQFFELRPKYKRGDKKD